MRLPKLALMVFSILLLGLLGLGGCQNQASRNDPQNEVEPRSAPGEGQQFLAKLAGNWNVVKTFYPRTGEPSVVNGECKQRMVQGGKFLESDFVFQDPGGDTTGMGLIGYDAEQGQFTSFWVDSRSTRVSIRVSQDKFDGEKIELYNRSLAAAGPATRESRTESRLENGGKTLIHRQYGPSADGGERLVMELYMTRK